MVFTVLQVLEPLLVVPTATTITSPAVTAIVPEQVDPGLFPLHRMTGEPIRAAGVLETVTVWEPVLAKLRASPG